MGREVDRRDFRTSRRTPNREARLRTLAAEVSTTLPGAHSLEIAGFDATTGNPATVLSQSAPSEREHYVQRALQHLQRTSLVSGLEATQPVEYTADPNVQRTSSDAVTVHVQQRYKGIPIFQAAQAVRFDPSGRLEATVGSAVGVSGELEPAPRLSAAEAVLRAAEHVATPQEDELGATDQFGEPIDLPSVPLGSFSPTILAAFPDRPECPTVLTGGPFAADIPASLTWFPLDPDELRLGWLVVLTMPGNGGQYRAIVDADDGEILYCRQLARTVAARGNVFRIDGGAARELVELPRPLEDYRLPLPVPGLPQGFPDTWVATDRTVGNAVEAHLGDDGPPLRGAVRDGTLVLDPADQDGDEQRTLNLFYLGCSMHDYFYLLGFREADGNFQRDNVGRGGLAADPVDARVHSGPVAGTANMLTPVDGTRPVMNMGLVSNANRHTALDSTVVFHEYTHGVSNRLVGGPLNVDALDAAQSAAIGEGLGDYTACTLNDTTVIGAWVTGRPGGIRGFPYDADFPDGFGDLGTGRYREVHANGEVWCATLLEMNRRIGRSLGIQLVVDALKLSPANPSFPDMRDAILAALDGKLAAGQLAAAEHATARAGIWGAFAKFGMGPRASSFGASLFGISAHFDVPATAEPRPDAPAVDAEPLGDDFKVIKGIGPGIERNLHDAGIRTYAHLAALTPAEIARLAGASGRSSERVAKQDWAGQARALAARLAPVRRRGEARPEAPLDAEAGADRQHYATFMVELLLDEHSDVRRTRVVHVQQEDQEGGRESWPGWEDGRLVRYFVEHAALRPSPGKARTGAQPAEVHMVVDDIEFEEVPAGGGGPAFASRVRATVPFRLAGKAGQQVATSRSAFFVHVLAYLLTTGETTVLAAAQGQLEPGTLSYVSSVEFAPPDVGRYQLLGAVVLTEHSSLGVAVGPKLNVVP